MSKQKILVVFLILLSSLSLFSQNKPKGKDSIRLHRLDDSVDYYENAGIGYYHHLKFDTAIKKFRRAGYFIDSLSVERDKLTDYVNNLVTGCNIALCYCKLHKAGLGLREVPEINNAKWYDLTGNNRSADRTCNKILAFTQFIEGDCYKEMNLKKSLFNYFCAYCNLHIINFPDAISLTYKYALKSYLYKHSYKDTLFFATKVADSVDVNLYKNILKEISKDN